MIFVLICLGLEFFAAKKGWIYGFVPIAIVSICCICLSIYAQSQLHNSKICIETMNLSGSTYAEVTVKTDEKDNLISYSHIYVKDMNGELIDVAEIGFDNEKVYSRYEVVAEDFAKKYEVKGDSFPLERVNGNFVELGGLAVSPETLYLSMAAILLPLIYMCVLGRWISRVQRRKRELKKMKLAEL